MGACSSTPPHIASTYSLSQSSFDKLNHFTSLVQMSPSTLSRFRRDFQRLDYDKSGTISMAEFLVMFNIDRTKFTTRAFSLLDQDKSGTIDFLEFTAAIYNYCTMDWSTLVRFSFDLFDSDGSGRLEKVEIEKLVCYVAGTKTPDTRSKKVLNLMDDDADGQISFGEFLKYNRKFPNLLFPAFALQTKLRRKVMSEAFWERKTVEVQRMTTHTGVTVASALEEAHRGREIVEDKVAERIKKNVGDGGGGGGRASKEDVSSPAEKAPRPRFPPAGKHQYERPMTVGRRSEDMYNQGMETANGEKVGRKKKAKKVKKERAEEVDKENSAPFSMSTSVSVSSHTISAQSLASLGEKKTQFQKQEKKKPSASDIRVEQRAMAEKQLQAKKQAEMNKKFKRPSGFTSEAYLASNARKSAPKAPRSPFGNITMAAFNVANRKRPQPPIDTPPKKRKAKARMGAALMNSPGAKAIKNMLMSPFSAKKKKRRKSVQFTNAGPVSINFDEGNDMLRVVDID